MNDFSADPQRASAVASRVLLGAAVLGLAACAIVFTVTYQGNVVDDALISFRYAVNLVEGRGLVFNPGERVEGYTNFLWTIVLAGVYAVAGSTSAMMPRHRSGRMLLIAPISKPPALPPSANKCPLEV